MSNDRIGRIFLLEYKEKPEQLYIGNKVGIILRKHNLKFNFAEESYHVLLEDKFRVIHLPNKENVSYKISFI